MQERAIPVGAYIEKFNELTGQALPCGTIYQFPGLLAHVKKRHPSQIGHVYQIAEVIKSPDYIGKHPKERESIELVKALDQNVMVCVKLDQGKDHYYVASVYAISEAKLKNRLNSGRLKKYP